MPVIGFLRSTTEAGSAQLVAALRQGLKEAGFVEGQDVAIDFRWGDDQPDRLPELAADLVRRQPAVIIGNVLATRAAMAATTAIPIVFVGGSDPIRTGLVANLNRPGGNVTGVSFLAAELGSKRLELLRQLVPTATMIAALVNPGSANTEAERREVQAAAQAIGQQLTIFDVSSERDIETAFRGQLSIAHANVSSRSITSFRGSERDAATIKGGHPSSTTSRLSQGPNELTGAPKARIVSFPTRRQRVGLSPDDVST
jgi:putative tryptophan/tyrosine transport system substrate-binding protein